MAVIPNKTIGVSYLAWQDIAGTAGTVVVGATIDVTSKWGITIHGSLGRLNGTAFTAGYPTFRCQLSGKNSGNDAWVDVFPYTAAIGASIGNTTLNGSVSAGATSVVLTSGTNFNIGDLVFLGHTTDVTKYELVRVVNKVTNTITLLEACTYAHDTGAVATSQAERFTQFFGTEGYANARVVIDNSNSGQGIKARVLYNLFDSI